MDLVESPGFEFKRIGRAITNVTSATLEPKALPKDKTGFPSIAEVTPTTASGREVAMATNKKLIVYPEIPSLLAMSEEESINILTAWIRVMEPAVMSSKFISVDIYV
jgi:hypothetical protein